MKKAHENTLLARSLSLTHLIQVNDPSHTPLKHKRISGSLMFSVDMEVNTGLKWTIDYILITRSYTEVTYLLINCPFIITHVIIWLHLKNC